MYQRKAMEPQLTDKQLLRQAQKDQKQQKIQEELQKKQEENKIEIRENVRNAFARIFTNYLDTHKGDVVEDAVDIDTDKVAKHLEKHIYNYTIAHSKQNGIRPIVWSNNVIQGIYKERTRNLLCNLNPNGYVKNKTLIKRLLVDREFDLHELVFEMLTHRELMPERYVAYDEEIRLERELIENYVDDLTETGLLKCPKCKRKFTDYYQLQKCRADESPHNYATCKRKECGYKWVFR